MVHALEKAQRWLEPEGVIVSIYPVAQPAAIEFHDDDGITRIGTIQHRLNFENQKLALAAVAHVIEEGLLTKEREIELDFLSHAASILALRDHLEEHSQNSFIDDETMQRAEELSPKSDKVVRRERIRITRLRPMSPLPNKNT